MFSPAIVETRVEVLRFIICPAVMVAEQSAVGMPLTFKIRKNQRTRRYPVLDHACCSRYDGIELIVRRLGQGRDKRGFGDDQEGLVSRTGKDTHA
jgi:hypothetical protein